MKAWGFVAVALCAGAPWATAAHAADKPIFAPPAAWVKPTPLPATDGKSDGAAIHMLLQDQQVDLAPGSQSRYSENLFRIQTPQGLSAGSISIAWNPDIDTLTIHKLHILRGDKTIDVLASGQTFTVLRRETNLDNAMLDGVLTATIQPEGLQVGDVVDFAATVTRSDPAVKNHAEAMAGGWTGIPVDHVRFRAAWPSALPIRLHTAPGLPPLKPHKDPGNRMAVDLSLDNLQPFVVAKGAPQRYGVNRIVEMSDFSGWSAISDLMAPLYVKAATLPASGPLVTEVDAIRAKSTDPKARAEAALALVQDRVRYVFLGMNDGGLMPTDAATTWSRRFGDCKAKTALLLAILHALDIEAQPVLVSTGMGDGLDQRLPTVGAFDHIFVKAMIAGKTYLLDGTRTGDRHLDGIEVPAFHWALPIGTGGGTLVALMPPPYDKPRATTTIRIDASAGISLPAPVHVEMVTTGDQALETNLRLSNLTGDALDRALRAYWKSEYDFIEVNRTSVSYDPDSRTEKLVMDGLATMEWRGDSFETDGSGVGYKADFSRDPGADKDAPFAVAYPFYTRNVEQIVLPHGWTPRPNPTDEVDQTVAGIAYHRHVAYTGNVFSVEMTARSVQQEFPASDAVAARATLRQLADNAVYLRRPQNYVATAKEVAAAMEKTPTTASEFVTRGNMLLDHNRLDEAIADFDKAIALDPKMALALADRGIAHLHKKQEALAKQDLDAAAALDPRQIVVYRARGIAAMMRNAPQDAIAALSTALDIEPDDYFSLGLRAQVYRALGDDAHVLADATARIRQRPDDVPSYLLRANAYRHLGQEDKSLAEATALIAANPDNAFAQVTAARIYATYGKQDEAKRAFDRAIAIKPEAYVYINRSMARPKTDIAGRQADLDAAFKLSPLLPEVLNAIADFKLKQGNYAGAISDWTARLIGSPHDPDLLIHRAIAYAKSGQQALADRDFAAAHTLSLTPEQLNSSCWDKATAGVALQSALADCDAALAKTPDNPAYRDSRAFVLLRLNRLDEAQADYDKALAQRTKSSASLFGRAVVEARKGDKAKSALDLQAALKADPDVQTDFAGYGVSITS